MAFLFNDVHTSQSRTWGRYSQKIIPVFLSLVFLVSLASPQFSASAAPASPRPLAQGGGDGRFSAAPCSNFKVPANWREGQDVQCGYLTVPTEHGGSATDTIQLGVVIVKSTNPNPPADPIVMLQGGPGGSTIDTYTQLIPLEGQDVRANRDIILFDQRGTLYSKPSLLCPESLDMTLQYLDVKLTPEQSDQKALQALSACRTRLEKEGVNLSAYDSIQNAADIESLRQALGYDKINLYGVSYGTLLALHYMRQYPQSLRTVILDSTVPPQVNFILDAPRSEDRSFEALFTACAKDAQCNESYPNLRQVFFDLVDQLNKNPVHVQLTDPFTLGAAPRRALLDGDSLLSTVFQMMYNTDIIPYVPKTIYDVRNGNYDFLERILSIVVFDKTTSIGMYYSTMCAEDADVNPKDYSLSGLPPQIQASEKDNISSFIQTCQMWNVQALGPQADQPVNSSVPTLVLSGAFDPITPPAYGQMAAQTLIHSYFVLFPNGGHGEAMSGPCPDSVMISFLNNPSQKPDESCVSGLGGPKFVTPGAMVRLPSLIQILNLQGTAGIELVLYLLALLFLLTALAVYPIVGVVRLIRGGQRTAASAQYPDSSQSAAGYPGQYSPQPQPGYPAAPARRPLLYRLAPWISALTGLLLLTFTAVLIGIIFNMVVKNDTMIMMGLPAVSRPLFILPILAVLLVLVMLLAAFTAWARRAGSVWGRVYFTLITLSAVACVLVLGAWGMITALVG